LVNPLSIFKDAQAAIYGTIGANGVILITTKTGKKFKAKNQFQFPQVFRKQQSRLLVEYHCSMKVMQTEVQFLSLM
jgi:TonB-dependent SusC/RagA subfamily outer membrane receptor